MIWSVCELLENVNREERATYLSFHDHEEIAFLDGVVSQSLCGVVHDFAVPNQLLHLGGDVEFVLNFLLQVQNLHVKKQIISVT